MAALHLNADIDMSHVMVGTMSFAPYGYNSTSAGVFFNDISTRLSANPALRSVAFSVSQGGMTSSGKLAIDGVPRQFPTFVTFTSVDLKYFQTLRIPLLKGRNFSKDDRPN